MPQLLEIFVRAYELGCGAMIALHFSACGARTLPLSYEDAGADQAPSTQANPAILTGCVPTSSGFDPSTLAYSAGVPAVTGWYGSTLTIVTGAPLAGFTARRPDELVNNSAAQDPSFVYLRRGIDAVRLSGPCITVSSTTELADLITPHNSSAQSYVWGENSETGIRFSVNSRLRFDIRIVDFENEIALGWVELTPTENTMQTNFIFLGIGGGVAHDIQNTVYVDGIPGYTTPPVAIEVRQ